MKNEKYLEEGLEYCAKVANKMIKGNSKYFDDYYQTACMGLVRALQLYDENKSDASFKTYAYKAIQTTIYREFKKGGVLAHDREILFLEHEYSSGDDDDVITLMDLTLNSEDDTTSFEADYLYEKYYLNIEKMIKNPNHVKIFKIRFKHPDWTYAKIAREVGYSREGVSKIFKKINDILINQMRRDGYFIHKSYLRYSK